jgi:acyl transferase domain-containing protein
VLSKEYVNGVDGVNEYDNGLAIISCGKHADELTHGPTNGLSSKLSNGHTNHSNGNTNHSNGTTHSNGHTNHSNGNTNHSNGINHSNGHTTHINGVTNGDTNGASATKTTPQILCLSAKDETALTRTADRYASYLSTTPWTDTAQLRQLAHTLITRRTLFPWRSFAIVGGGPGVDKAKIGEEATRSDSSKLGIAYVFTGQGAQYTGMGKQLLVYQVFADTLRAIGVVYKSLGAQWHVIDELCEGQNMQDPEFSQPLCTALQIATAELLKSWNVVPLTVIGHSSGEIAAAYVTGALSLSSACKVAYWRGKVSGALAKRPSTPGAMLSVNLSESAMAEYLSENACGKHGLSIACINSPSNVTISGPKDDVDRLSKRLVADKVQVFQVHTGVAYHSPAMMEVAEEYRNHLHDLECRSGDPSKDQVTMISTVTGHAESQKRISSAQYWVDNLVSPVRFSDAVEIMAATQSDSTRKLGALQLRPVFDVIEIGPHSALRYPVTTTLKGLDKQKGSRTRYWSVLDRVRPQIEVSLQLPARLFARGYPVDIGAVNTPVPGEAASPLLCDTPAYPFNHEQRYWKESRLSRDWRRRGGGPANGILGVRVSDWNPLEPRWRKFVSIEEMPWIADHVVSLT